MEVLPSIINVLVVIYHNNLHLLLLIFLYLKVLITINIRTYFPSLWWYDGKITNLSSYIILNFSLLFDDDDMISVMTDTSRHIDDILKHISHITPLSNSSSLSSYLNPVTRYIIIWYTPELSAASWQIAGRLMITEYKLSFIHVQTIDIPLRFWFIILLNIISYRFFELILIYDYGW